MKKILCASALAIAVAAAPAFAQDGSLSSTSSSAEVDISTTIPKLVRISGLQDITLTASATDLANTSGAYNRGQTFCVYSNDTMAGLYKLSVNGQAGAELNTGEAKYSLSGPEGQTLSFALWTSDVAANAYAGGTATPGVAKSFKTTSGGQARTTTLNCNGTENASMNVRFTNARILAAVAGTYTGTLTFVVEAL
jgi:hypothetical protein